MGVFAWLRERFAGSKGSETAAGAVPTTLPGQAAHVHDPAGSWVDVPPFVDMEQGEERTLVSVLASAIAAGDRPQSSFEILRVGRENPEYRRVAVISAAIAAADRPSSSFRCVRIRRRRAAKSAWAAARHPSGVTSGRMTPQESCPARPGTR